LSVDWIAGKTLIARVVYTHSAAGDEPVGLSEMRSCAESSRRQFAMNVRYLCNQAENDFLNETAVAQIVRAHCFAMMSLRDCELASYSC